MSSQKNIIKYRMKNGGTSSDIMDVSKVYQPQLTPITRMGGQSYPLLFLVIPIIALLALLVFLKYKHE